MRAAIVAILLLGCAAPRRAGVGTECELNSQCAAPLVCRLGYCRNECATSGDCSPPLACVRDQDELGACQLFEEQDCSLDTECPAPLVCRTRQCVEQCANDRDCLGGARCQPFPEGNACIDESVTSCVRDSECAGMFCIAGRCRRQCYTDRDCRFDYWCDPSGVCSPPPRPNRDAGEMDSGAGDAGVPDAGPVGPCRGGPLTNVIQLSVGRGHVCALVNDAGVPRVYCWGPSFVTGALATAPCASEVTGLAGMGVREVAAGGTFTCVRDRSDQVLCFGLSTSGELGRGPTAMDASPAPASGLVAISIAAGGSHACAHPTLATLDCWGANTSMQLGDGTVMNRLTPVSSTFAPDSTGISLGRLHSCGLDPAGTPICWGDDTFGQLGNGGGAAITGATMVSAGGEHTCALAAGTVYCWGQNGLGGLGDGTTTSRNTRQPVVGIGAATAVDAGNYHTCAIVDTDVYCWGMSDGIEPGASHAVLTPTLVFSGVDAIAAGDDFTCALSAGQVSCVGMNTFGVLGDGTMDARYIPATVMRQ